jgi:hypothetical protein
MLSASLKTHRSQNRPVGLQAGHLLRGWGGTFQKITVSGPQNYMLVYCTSIF